MRAFQPKRAKPLNIFIILLAGGENGFNQAIELSSDMLANVKFVQVSAACASLGSVVSGRHCVVASFGVGPAVTRMCTRHCALCALGRTCIAARLCWACLY